MKELCQCQNPTAPGIHWLAEDGECCPPGCDCSDCQYWYPYINIKLEPKND